MRDLGTEVEVSDGVKPGGQVVLMPPVDLGDGDKVQGSRSGHWQCSRVLTLSHSYSRFGLLSKRLETPT